MATTSPIIIPVKTPGLSQLQKMEMRMKALEKTVEKLNADLLKNASATKAAGRAAGTATGNIQRMGIAFRTTLGPIVALYGAFNFLNKSLQVASQRQVNIAKLTNGLRNLGGTEGDLAKLVAVADEFGRSTLFDQEDATQAFALLTSFQRIGVESYERVTKAASDLATVTGTDLKSAQIQLAKALEDPAKRVTDLARSGTVFTDQQKEQIKVLQESGQLFEAQNLILKEIEKQYGGAAEAAGSAGLAGALDTLGEATRDFQEALVNSTTLVGLAEAAIYGLADAIDGLTFALQQWDKIIRQVDIALKDIAATAGVVGDAFGALGDAFGWAADQLGRLLLRSDGMDDFLALGQDRFKKGALANLPADYKAQEQALAQAAAGFSSAGRSSGTATSTGGGSSRSGRGADAAAKAAEREAERVAKTLRDREQLVERLEQQLKIQNAVTGLSKEEATLQLDNLEINQRYDNLLLKETDELIRQNTERARALDLDLARQRAQESMMSAAQSDFTNFFKQQPEYQGLFNDELTETEQLLKNSYEIVSNGLQSGIKGLIDGTKEWGDVLSDIAGQLGSMFLNMGFNALGAGLKIPGFAEGGYVDSPTQAMIGEAGEPEYAIPSSKMSSAMTRYSQGMRGEAVTAGASEHGGDAEGGTGEGGASAIDVSYSVSQINSVNYVTEESFQRGMNEAAARGAKAGEARALGRLRTSVGVRSKLGLS